MNGADDEWLAAYGAAMRAVQEFELELVHLLWVYRLREESAGTGPALERDLTDDLEWRTLTKVLRQVTERGVQDFATTAVFFESVRELRDILAHHYFRLFRKAEADVIEGLNVIKEIFVMARGMIGEVRARYVSSPDVLYEDARVDRLALAVMNRKFATLAGAIGYAAEIAHKRRSNQM